MALRFDDRVVVVTGGGRGLGQSYATLLGSLGAKVVVNDLGSSLQGMGDDEGAAASVVREIREAGGEAVANTDSVATEEGARAIVATALDTYGRIDALIHSAGNVRRGSLTDMTYEDFDAVVAVHMRGGYNVVREAFPHMAKAGYGRIVLTSSIGGAYGNYEVANYSMSKGALISLSHVAALEGAKVGIKSNAILPSAVTRMAEGLDTSQYPPLGPELVSPMIAYLCHETCEVSGEILIALGGRMARAALVESPGVYRPSWTIDAVAAEIDTIRDIADPLHFAPGEFGFGKHLGYSFGMAKQGAE
jgi:NAD(P)-dependent dehydrogenase (short-subunit alcohol dehydrogenase family)